MKVGDVLRDNPGYYSWIQNADFPMYTKKVLTQIKEKTTPKKHVNSLEDLKNKFNNKI
jgi:DNA polymerase-3 subunit epsilon